VLVVSFVTCMMGCGGKNLFPVKGTVVYKDGADASVLAGGRVIFQPADPEMPNVSPRGQIQKDGSFQMTTPTEGDGVHPGTTRSSWRRLTSPKRAEMTWRRSFWIHAT
jgi:hypothetical protein